MSHHFAQMCAHSFFLVQAAHCLDAGSCSLIVSQDCCKALYIPATFRDVPSKIEGVIPEHRNVRYVYYKIKC